MPQIIDWLVNLTIEDVFRAQGADADIIKTRSKKLFELTQSALEKARPLIKPLIIYKKLSVENFQHHTLHLEGGHTICGEFLAQQMAGVSQIFVVVCTVGNAIETLSHQIMPENMSFGYAIDGVGTAAAEILADMACKYFDDLSKDTDLKTTLRFSPGSEGWPVEQGQPQIFKMLESENNEIQLTANYQMLPLKSLSFIIGSGKDINIQGSICDFCTMRGRCTFQGKHP